MVREIIWTPQASKTFQNIISYLEEQWTEKEIIYFVKTTDKLLEYISHYPEMFRKTNKRNVHEALITSHNIVIYKVYPKRIDLITFWDTRQHPRTKKF